MAVTTTPRDILLGAYGKSKKNQPQQIATEETELLNVVIRALRGIYAIASLVNPAHYAGKNTVTGAGGAWLLPDGVTSIWRLEKTDGSDVDLVPVEERTSALGAAVIYYGRQYWPANAGTPDPDPAADSLVIYASSHPADPADLDSTLDPLWDEDFNELLELEVAVYLAIKDGRDEEIGPLRDERDRWAGLFLQTVELMNLTEVRAFELAPMSNTNRAVPVSAYLAGGSSLSI